MELGVKGRARRDGEFAKVPAAPESTGGDCPEGCMGRV